MAIGDVFEVDGCPDVYYVDTGMYGVSEYGAVYLIDAERPALVDTGIGTNYGAILEMLDAAGVDREDLAAILVTHVHLDHAGGVGYLAEACPNADVYVHEIGAPHLASPDRLIEGTKRAVGDQWQYYAQPRPVDEARIVELAGGDRVDLGDRTLDVHHAPGHAPHQVVFHDGLADAVFAADAAGIWLPSLEAVDVASPPPNFDAEQVVADMEMLADLDPAVLLFAHFGPGSGDVQHVLAEASAAVEEWVEAIAAKRAAWDDRADVIEHFVSRNETHEVWGDERAEADTAMSVRGVLQYLE